MKVRSEQLGGYARGCLIAASFAPFRLPLMSASAFTLPLPLPLSSPLFSLPEEEQQHVGQIRATGRLRARVFSSCQPRTVAVAVEEGEEPVAVAVVIAVEVAVWGENKSGR